jgi:methyl-accepting chemotaxis protein
MTALLQNFTIRTRMLGAIAMVLFFFAVLSAAGFIGMSQVEANGKHFIASTHADAVLLSKLRVAIGSVQRFGTDSLLSLGDATEAAASLTHWKQAIADARSQAQALVADGNGDEGATLAGQIDTRLAKYQEQTEPLLRQAHADAAAAKTALVPAAQALREIEAVGDKLAIHLDEERKADEAAAASTLQHAYGLLYAAIALAVVGVVPLTLLNMNSICRPIAEAQSLARTIAEGDLTSRIVITGRDESAHLLQALATMQGSLRTLVGQVRSSTDHIGTASSEIASGNQDLSTRTEQTASNLQVTASSMLQLTGTVNQSADSARQANQLATSAAEVAARGGVVVSQVVTTMDDINTSSKRIGDIIGVIDGIAFQTNILALNAAVEAARAGEQGRGFAVVASEVRSLAQRSAEAAKEIKTLIGASVEKVEGGSRLVADAGRTMNEIVTSVQRVSDIIGEITAAAAEQSQGIGQINGSVGELDQMTQQNAALVEESAAAAQSLRDQATHLAAVVGTFKLGDSAGAAH